VEQELNTLQQLAAVVRDHRLITEQDTALLESYIAKYPYFQPLHLLLSRTDPDNGRLLGTAALYCGGLQLHRVLGQPENSLNTTFQILPGPGLYQERDEPSELAGNAIDEVVPENEPSTVIDEQEVFEEIGEVDIREYTGALTEAAPHESSPGHDLVLENIVSTDFFAFQDSLDIEEATDDTPKIEEYDEKAEQEQIISKYDDDRLPYTFLWWLAKTRKEHEQIFQPYATPKANREMPGRTPAAAENSALQQQYIEHIFHVQSAFGKEEDDLLPADHKQSSKGKEIIENFIRNEPQISTPKPEQINNENKAKKSAEDHSDLVSETLANIYIEQMLYDKAIETYEKLSLMFPEKSRYFADLIQSIEKKI